MKFVILIITIGLHSNFVFSQNLNHTKVELQNCTVSESNIDSLKNDLIFKTEHVFTSYDTLYLQLIHHRNQAPITKISYWLTKDNIETSMKKSMKLVKPGDKLSFLFKYGSFRNEKTYTIGSTMNSLTKPYYLDLSFIYNKDTVTAKDFDLKQNLKQVKKLKSIRVFFNNPKELSSTIEIRYKKKSLSFPFEGEALKILYRGRVTLEYFDKKNYTLKDPYNKKIHFKDIDTEEGFSHGTMFSWSN